MIAPQVSGVAVEFLISNPISETPLLESVPVGRSPNLLFKELTLAIDLDTLTRELGEYAEEAKFLRKPLRRMTDWLGVGIVYLALNAVNNGNGVGGGRSFGELKAQCLSACMR